MKITNNQPADDVIPVEEDKTAGMTEVKKVRLQMVLASETWGIPSLAFCDAYKKMFGRPLNIEDLGYKHLSHMVSSLPEVFTVQDPDEITALMFPDYPQDYILHDARFGRDFASPELDLPLAGEIDANLLISLAWLNRDEEFPPDVVLAGEEYSDILLPMAHAKVPGTSGVYQAVLVGVASPGRMNINIKNETFDRIDGLSAQVAHYFRESKLDMEAYSVPKEFIYPGFPCLVYQAKQNLWERAEIIGQRDSKVLVKTVDYGVELATDRSFLYLMPKEYLDIPKQALTVSMLGIEPAEGAKRWDQAAGTRLRCFSNRNYWLDCLLVKPKEPRRVPDELIDSDENVKRENQKGDKKKKRVDIDFEVIICDRNDEYFDLYLDYVLTLETQAAQDGTRKDELEGLKSQMTQALNNVTRPINPLGDLFEVNPLKAVA